MATKMAKNLLGRHKLVERLAQQVGDKGMAIAILKKRGDLDRKGHLTAAGHKLDNMTAKERALARATKRTGKPASAFTYDSKTNITHVKKKKKK